MEQDLAIRYANLAAKYQDLEERLDYLLTILDEGQYKAYINFCHDMQNVEIYRENLKKAELK